MSTAALRTRRRKATRTGRQRPPSAAPPRDGHTEQRILDAAHTVFLRRGTAGARMQDIARAARVNQALLHYYFRTKNRLAEAVFRRAAGQLFQQVIGVMASDLAIEEKVRRVVDVELAHLSRTPGLPGYILSELHHQPERVPLLIASLTGTAPVDIRSVVVGTLRQQIAREVQAGTLRPIAAEQFIVNLLSLCVFPFAARPMLAVLLGLEAEGFAKFIDERRQQLADFFLKALRP